MPPWPYDAFSIFWHFTHTMEETIRVFLGFFKKKIITLLSVTSLNPAAQVKLVWHFPLRWQEPLLTECPWANTCWGMTAGGWSLSGEDKSRSSSRATVKNKHWQVPHELSSYRLLVEESGPELKVRRFHMYLLLLLFIYWSNDTGETHFVRNFNVFIFIFISCHVIKSPPCLLFAHNDSNYPHLKPFSALWSPLF